MVRLTPNITLILIGLQGPAQQKPGRGVHQGGGNWKSVSCLSPIKILMFAALLSSHGIRENSSTQVGSTTNLPSGTPDIAISKSLSGPEEKSPPSRALIPGSASADTKALSALTVVWSAPLRTHMRTPSKFDSLGFICHVRTYQLWCGLLIGSRISMPKYRANWEDCPLRSQSIMSTFCPTNSPPPIFLNNSLTCTSVSCRERSQSTIAFSSLTVRSCAFATLNLSASVSLVSSYMRTFAADTCVVAADAWVVAAVTAREANALALCPVFHSPTTPTNTKNAPTISIPFLHCFLRPSSFLNNTKINGGITNSTRSPMATNAVALSFHSCQNTSDLIKSSGIADRNSLAVALAALAIALRRIRSRNDDDD
jgi:hypothetical protein